METLKDVLAQFAYANSYTHNYIFGFAKDGKQYALWIKNLSVAEIKTLGAMVNPSSKNAARGVTLAFKGRATAAYILGMSGRGKLQCIGTAASYEADYKEWHTRTGYNRGDYFEYVIAKMNNQTWDKHNSTSGNIAGDLIIDGVHWQLKANGGNFANERQMRN